MKERNSKNKTLFIQGNPNVVINVPLIAMYAYKIYEYIYKICQFLKTNVLMLIYTFNHES